MEEESLDIPWHHRGRLSLMPAGPMEGFEVLLTCPKFSLGFFFGGGTPAQARTYRMTYLFEGYSLDTERRELRCGTDLISVEPQVL